MHCAWRSSPRFSQTEGHARGDGVGRDFLRSAARPAAPTRRGVGRSSYSCDLPAIEPAARRRERGAPRLHLVGASFRTLVAVGQSNEDRQVGHERGQSAHGNVGSAHGWSDWRQTTPTCTGWRDKSDGERHSSVASAAVICHVATSEQRLRT